MTNRCQKQDGQNSPSPPYAWLVESAFSTRLYIYLYLPVDFEQGEPVQCLPLEKDVFRFAEHVTARIAIAVRGDGRVAKAAVRGAESEDDGLSGGRALAPLGTAGQDADIRHHSKWGRRHFAEHSFNSSTI